MLETWVLFFMLMTTPGNYEVVPLEIFTPEKTTTAEIDCKKTLTRVSVDYAKAYVTELIKDTYAFVCLKQKEKEA